MRNRFVVVGSILILIGLVTLSVMAQGRMQQQGAMQPALHVIPQNIVTLVGTVTAVNMAPGQGLPSITLQTSAGPVTILVGPYRIVMDSKFEFKQAQGLEIKAFQDPQIANAYVATEIKDTGTGATLVLRDASGVPHMGGGAMGMQRRGDMMGMQRGGAMGMQRGAMGMQHNAAGAMRGTGACAHNPANVDLKAATTLDGTVTSVNMAPGQGIPTFTLQVGGKNLIVTACPYQALVQADFRISVNDHMSVVAYPFTDTEGSYLAGELNNLTTQKTLKLRDDSGLPLGMQGRGTMAGIRRRI